MRKINYKKIEKELEDRVLKEFKYEDCNDERTYYRMVMFISEVLEEEYGILSAFNLDFTEDECMPLIDIRDEARGPEWVPTL